MLLLNNNTQAFLALVRAGLWEKDVQLLPYHDIDWHEVYRLAIEQSVLGLLLAGLEHSDIKPPQGLLLQWIGEVQQIEQRNKAMNSFVAELLDGLRKEDVCCLLVKGQGVAQCYEKPLWRESGDIDLLLSDEDYKRTKTLLTPLAEEVHEENIKNMHLSMNMKGYIVELHGKMPFLLSNRVDRVIDEILDDSLHKGGVMTGKLEGKDILLPNLDNHIFIVFTHFLHHFFIEGVGLKQICDWCRMLWTYRHEIDVDLLGIRLHEAGLMSEWKAFASLAVKTLGMPVDAMPFYDEVFKRKGEMVLRHILKAGNFGQNNDLSYRVKYKGCAYKMVSFWRRLVDFVNFVPIFPLDAPKFFVTYVFSKVK